MNLGLGNLQTLKRALLADSQQDNPAFDELIAQIGIGVASQLETFCNRKFARQVGATDEFNGERSYWIARRFPVEQITSLITRWGGTDPEDVTSLILTTMPASGMIDFGGILGDYHTRCTLTYDGGFWFDESEDGSGVLPEGAAPLPSQIGQAWIMQSKHVFECYDVLGTQMTKGGAAKDTANIKLLDVVQQLLSSEVRFLS